MSQFPIHVHDAGGAYTKMFQVVHPWPVAAGRHAPGTGKGVMIYDGPAGTVREVIAAVLKVDQVMFYVGTGPGCFIVSITEPRRWDELIGQIQSTIGSHITDANRLREAEERRKKKQ
jgi:hypothetical protein